jgi:hypothetical protein
MIYILLANGASVIPSFLPGIPQLLLVLVTLRILAKQRLPMSLPIFAVMLGIFLLFALSAISSLPDQMGRFAKLLVNTVVAYVLAAGLAQRYRDDFPHQYSRVLFLFTVTGILGLLLAFITDWNVTFALGDRTYHTNLLTTWLTDGDFNSSQTYFSPFPYRLQSMFDEPGTFGILLVPAFFHYVQKGRTKEIIILLIGALLSESANAWALCLLILMGKIWTLEARIAKATFFAVLTGLLIPAMPTLVKLYEIKTGLDEAYANSSSLGTRSLEYAYLQQNWERHLLPFQDLHALALFPDGISVSYVSWYIYGGLIFVSMLVAVVLGLAAISVQSRRWADPTRYFQIVLAVILLLSGAQRSSLFDNVLFMTLAFWTLLHRPGRLREVHAPT